MQANDLDSFRLLEENKCITKLRDVIPKEDMKNWEHGNFVGFFPRYDRRELTQSLRYPFFTPLHVARANKNQDMFEFFLKYCDENYFNRTKYMIGFVPLMGLQLEFIQQPDNPRILRLKFETGPLSLLVDHQDGTYTFHENRGIQSAVAKLQTARIDSEYETKSICTTVLSHPPHERRLIKIRCLMKNETESEMLIKKENPLIL